MKKTTKLIMCVGVATILSVGFQFRLSEPEIVAQVILALGAVGFFLSIVTTPHGFHGTIEWNIWLVGVAANAAVYWTFITLAEKLLQLRVARRDRAQLRTGN